MLLLKPLEYLPLLRLLTIHPSSSASLLLPLLNHHLLNHRPRRPIQITQLRRLGRDLGHVDSRRRSHHVRPPVHLVDFVEVERDFFTGGMGGCFEGPGGFAGVDGVGEGALQFVLARIPTQPYTYIEGKKKKKKRHLDNGRFSPNPNPNTVLAQVNVHIFALEIARDGRGHRDVADGLGPFVGEFSLFGIFEGFAGFFVFVCHFVCILW